MVVVVTVLVLSITFQNLALSPFYVKMKPHRSTWAGLLRVAVMAVQNRDLELTEENHGV